MSVYKPEATHEMIIFFGIVADLPKCLTSLCPHIYCHQSWKVSPVLCVMLQIPCNHLMEKQSLHFYLLLFFFFFLPHSLLFIRRHLLEVDAITERTF